MAQLEINPLSQVPGAKGELGSLRDALKLCFEGISYQEVLDVYIQSLPNTHLENDAVKTAHKLPDYPSEEDIENRRIILDAVKVVCKNWATNEKEVRIIL